MLTHIVAASENNIIGVKNGLPWRLPDDFKYFKNKTWGMPVIMGRATFESLKKDLPGRLNVVLTKKKDWKADNVVVAHTIDEAIDKAKDSGSKEIFIIGGGEIFRETLHMVGRVYLTRVHTTVEGDTTYPELNPAEWTQIKAETFPADERNNYSYTFEMWERKTRN